MVKKYEQYRFPRLFVTSELEFFFILGVENADDFGEEWDSTFRTPLGYLVISRDFPSNEERVFIYITIDVEDEGLIREIVKYSKYFSSLMTYSPQAIEFSTSYSIKQSSVKQKSISSNFRDFIINVLQEDFNIEKLHKILIDITR